MGPAQILRIDDFQVKLETGTNPVKQLKLMGYLDFKPVCPFGEWGPHDGYTGNKRAQPKYIPYEFPEQRQFTDQEVIKVLTKHKPVSTLNKMAVKNKYLW